MSSRSTSSLSPRAFVDVFLLEFLVVGLCLRIWILRSSPLSVERPAAWLAIGLSEELAVVALCSAAALLTLRRHPRWLVAALSCVGLGCAVAQLAWSEAVIYFGHQPRREDLALAAGNAQALSNFVDGASILRLAIVAVGVALGLRAAAWWARRASGIFSTWERCGVVGTAALCVALFPWDVHARGTGAQVFFAVARSLREAPLKDPGGRVAVPRSALPETAIRELAPGIPLGDYLSDRFPLAHRAPVRSAAAVSAPPGLKPNVVMILMEGVRARELGCYGGTLPGVTPNLDRLAREGVLVEEAYSPGTKTPEGELAFWSGLWAFPHEYVMTSRPDSTVTGLPELLPAAGWKSLFWIHNGEQTFYRRDRFYLPRGFTIVDGRDFGAGDTETNWGKSDRVLAKRAVDAMAALEEPFAAMVLTVSNHHPFQVPEDVEHPLQVDLPEERGFVPLPGTSGIVGRHTVPMLKTIHYTDEAVGLLVELARRHSFFGRTVFVIAGDHGLPILPLGDLPTEHGLAMLRHRVPMILYSPLLPAGLRVRGAASQADWPATFLGFVNSRDPRAESGRDLLDPATEAVTRPLVLYDSEARMVTVVEGSFTYHGVLPEGVNWNPEHFVREILVDTKSDPEGRVNLADAQPETRERLARAARVYFSVYPWLVADHRLRLPDSPPRN